MLKLHSKSSPRIRCTGGSSLTSCQLCLTLKPYTYRNKHAASSGCDIIHLCSTVFSLTARSLGPQFSAYGLCACFRTSFALILSWAVSFLLMQAAVGSMAPPVFGVPSGFLSFACLLTLNFGCFGRWRVVVLMGLFGASAFVALLVWSAAHEAYIINYSNRAHTVTPLVAQLRRLVNIKQWARALGRKGGLASLVQLAAAQTVLCLFATVVMFGRAFGHKLDSCKRKRRQKKRDKAVCEAIHQAATTHAHPQAVVETYTTEPAFDASLAPLPLPPPLPPPSVEPAKILVPPPPHAVFP